MYKCMYIYIIMFMYNDMFKLRPVPRLFKEVGGLGMRLKHFLISLSHLYTTQDIKPSNIGVSADNEIKLLDFGLARAKAEIMTGYVTTRHCRAPEIMLNWMHYTQKGERPCCELFPFSPLLLISLSVLHVVDIWSVGCVMAQMLTGQILFPGSDCIPPPPHTLTCILLHTPSHPHMLPPPHTLTPSHPHMHPPPHPHTLTCILLHTPSHPRTLTCILLHTPSHPHMHPPPHMHPYIHTYTHTVIMQSVLPYLD